MSSRRPFVREFRGIAVAQGIVVVVSASRLVDAEDSCGRGSIQKMAQMEVGPSKGLVERTFEVSGASSMRRSSFPVECWLSVCDTSTRSIASPSGDRWLDTLKRVVRLRSRHQIPVPLISGRESYQVVLSFCTRGPLVSPKIVAAVSRSIEARQGLPATRGARFRASQPKL